MLQERTEIDVLEILSSQKLFRPPIIAGEKLRTLVNLIYMCPFFFTLSPNHLLARRLRYSRINLGQIVQFRGTLRTMSNISSFRCELFSQWTPASMFDWSLNVPLNLKKMTLKGTISFRQKSCALSVSLIKMRVQFQMPAHF